MVPWDPPGVPRVPILGPNRGMFSKLNEPGPLGPGGHSHTILGDGRFQGAQRSFGCDVMAVVGNIFVQTDHVGGSKGSQTCVHLCYSTLIFLGLE